MRKLLMGRSPTVNSTLVETNTASECETSRRSSRRLLSPISSLHSRCTDGAEFEERWCELVAHETARAGVGVRAIFFTLHRSWTQTDEAALIWHLQQKENKLNSSVTAVGRFGDLKQDRCSLQVSDFKASEVHVVDVVFWFAEIIWHIRGNRLYSAWFLLTSNICSDCWAAVVVRNRRSCSLQKGSWVIIVCSRKRPKKQKTQFQVCGMTVYNVLFWGLNYTKRSLKTCKMEKEKQICILWLRRCRKNTNQCFVRELWKTKATNRNFCCQNKTEKGSWRTFVGC